MAPQPLKAICKLFCAASLPAVSALLLSCNPPNYPAKPIELRYYANGPWKVTVSIGTYCCDSAGDKFDVYYPSSPAPPPGGFPILSWGNGKNSTSTNYTFFLEHMASWGFVVVSAQDKNAGSGQTILDAANFMIAQNSVPGLFQSKLNVSQVGVFGHSQGAGGSINALIKSAGLIQTVMPLNCRHRRSASLLQTALMPRTSRRARSSCWTVHWTSPFLRQHSHPPPRDCSPSPLSIAQSLQVSSSSKER